MFIEVKEGSQTHTHAAEGGGTELGPERAVMRVPEGGEKGNYSIHLIQAKKKMFLKKNSENKRKIDSVFYNVFLFLSNSKNPTKNQFNTSDKKSLKIYTIN